MLNKINKNETQKIAIFFGTNSSDGKEGSKDGSDSDNLGFCSQGYFIEELFEC